MYIKQWVEMCLPRVGVLSASSVGSFGVGVPEVSSVSLGSGFLGSGGGSVSCRVGCPTTLLSSTRSRRAKRKELGRIHFAYQPLPT